MRRKLLVGLCLTSIVSVALAAAVVQQQGRRATAPAMTQAATAWLETLDDEQRAAGQYAYDAEERVGWHFIPKASRKGVQVKEMTDEQREAAYALLSSCLSRAGYTKARRIMAIEDLLAELERGRGTQIRDSARYYVTIFGDVSPESRWGLSIEGHHLSLNFVVEGEQVVSMTPMFFGLNPSVVNRDFEGFRRGARVLADEELLAFELVHSLSDEQQKIAIIQEQAPADIRNAGEAHPPTDVAEGIAFGELTTVQQSRLVSIVDTYLRNMTPDVARERRSEIDEAGWENIKFCWQGATRPGIGHAYRIQGPSFLIEFNNNQADADGNPAAHIHAVWRNPHGDFALRIAE
ncbi:MAG: DUF3500 domain-containing protein [Pirellulaceae bacterium]